MKTYVYNYHKLNNGKYLINAVRYSKINDKYSTLPITYSLSTDDFNKSLEYCKKSTGKSFPYVVEIDLVKGKGAVLINK